MSNEGIERILNYTTTMKSGTPYLEIVELIDEYKNQQKEIEEKTTIIMAGAEKVKQLEKEIQRLEKDNDTLSELVIVNEDKVIKELDLISKDKIREIIEHYNNELEHIKNGEEFENEKPMYYWGKAALEGLLEEN